MHRLIFAAALAGCAHAATPEPRTSAAAPPAAVAPPSAPSAAATSCPMITFSPHVLALREGILRNDGSVIRAELTWMHSSGALPDAQRPPLSDGHPDGGGDAASEEAHAASVFLGELGSACGSCHAKGPGPRFGPPEPPTAASGVASHMQRHLWAMDHLWEGLIGPSDVNWNQGVAVLAGSDLDPKQFAGRNEQDSPAGYLGPWIRKTGLEALHTGEPAERGRMFGDLLGTCAECHAGTRGAPDAEHPSPI